MGRRADPTACSPPVDAGYALEPHDDDGPDEGELVLLRCFSATAGYLPLASETRTHRSLTGGAPCATSENFLTNDRFRKVRIDGEEWLLYLCRADDLLVHTSGEMTNPLPTEQRLLAECPALISAVCLVGTCMPRCLALVELHEAVDAHAPQTRTALRAGLAVANNTQPSYSWALPKHALLLPHGSLPRTVKGTVQRSKAADIFADDLSAALKGVQPSLPTLEQAAAPGAGGSGGGEDAADGGDVDADEDANSITLVAVPQRKQERPCDVGLNHLAFCATFVVLVHHYRPFSCSRELTESGQGVCAPRLAELHRLLHPGNGMLIMPCFCLISGARGQRRGGSARSPRQAAVLLGLAVTYHYVLGPVFTDVFARLLAEQGASTWPQDPRLMCGESTMVGHPPWWSWYLFLLSLYKARTEPRRRRTPTIPSNVACATEN